MMPSSKEAFDLICGDTANSSTEKTLKNGRESNDEKLVEEPELKLLKKFDDKKRTNLILARMEKQLKKRSTNQSCELL